MRLTFFDVFLLILFRNISKISKYSCLHKQFLIKSIQIKEKCVIIKLWKVYQI